MTKKVWSYKLRPRTIPLFDEWLAEGWTPSRGARTLTRKREVVQQEKGVEVVVATRHRHRTAIALKGILRRMFSDEYVNVEAVLIGDDVIPITRKDFKVEVTRLGLGRGEMVTVHPLRRMVITETIPVRRIVTELYDEAKYYKKDRRRRKIKLRKQVTYLVPERPPTNDAADWLAYSHVFDDMKTDAEIRDFNEPWVNQHGMEVEPIPTENLRRFQRHRMGVSISRSSQELLAAWGVT